MQQYQISEINSSINVTGGQEEAVDVPSVKPVVPASLSFPVPVDDRGYPSSWDDEDYYLEAYAQGGGGTNQKAVDAQLAGVSYFHELGKVSFCERSYIEFQGADTGDKYMKFLECMKFFCPQCGKKHGHIHNRRKKHLYEKIDTIGGLDLYDMRQIVFTLPEDQRHLFKTRKGITAFVRMVKRIMEKEFPDRPMIEYFHAFGDEDPGKYHPHVNIHVLEPKGTPLFISAEKLARIKAKFKKALLGYGCRNIPVVNIYYSYFTDKVKKMHKLKYMSRPTPGYKNKEAILEDSELAMLFIVEMKGFQYIRYFGAWDKGGIEDGPETKQELEKTAGERLIYISHGVMGKTEFRMRWSIYETEEISAGFYRIKSG